MVVQRYFNSYSVRNGHIKRINDPDIELPVFEICGSNILNNFIAFPSSKNGNMKIKWPHLVLLVKNVKIFSLSLTNISGSRWLFWMIRVSKGHLFHAIINLSQELNHSNAQCHCNYRTDGMKLYSIWTIIARKHLVLDLWSVREYR